MDHILHQEHEQEVKTEIENFMGANKWKKILNIQYLYVVDSTARHTLSTLLLSILLSLIKISCGQLKKII
jgi:hypothetical protein